MGRELNYLFLLHSPKEEGKRAIGLRINSTLECLILTFHKFPPMKGFRAIF
jgi:hypothetical protein